MVWGLCQATAPTGATITTDLPWAVGSVTLGLLGLVGYLLKVTIPQIVADFRAESKADRDLYAARCESMQSLFSAELKAERENGDRARQEWRHTLLNLLNGKKLGDGDDDGEEG